MHHETMDNCYRIGLGEAELLSGPIEDRSDNNDRKHGDPNCQASP